MLSPKQLQLNNFQVGEFGEHSATTFLLNSQYRVLDSNLRWKKFEVDIVAVSPDGQTLVLVEVKTRLQKPHSIAVDTFGPISQAYSFQKKIAFLAIGKVIAAKMNWHKQIRFDLITVLLAQDKKGGKLEESKVQFQHYEYVQW